MVGIGNIRMAFYGVWSYTPVTGCRDRYLVQGHLVPRTAIGHGQAEEGCTFQRRPRNIVLALIEPCVSCWLHGEDVLH